MLRWIENGWSHTAYYTIVHFTFISYRPDIGQRIIFLIFRSIGKPINYIENDYVGRGWLSAASFLLILEQALLNWSKIPEFMKAE